MDKAFYESPRARWQRFDLGSELTDEVTPSNTDIPIDPGTGDWPGST